MRWIKASERTPSFEYVQLVHLRYSTDKTGFKLTGFYKDGKWYRQNGEDNILDWAPNLEWLDESATDDMPAAFQNEPVNFLLSNALRHLTQDQQRQLCNALLERLPAATDETLKDEAEGLYKYTVNGDFKSPFSLNEICKIQRSAYLAAASRYQSEIQRMGELLMSKDGEIEGLKAERESLKEQIKDLEQLLRESYKRH